MIKNLWKWLFGEKCWNCNGKGIETIPHNGMNIYGSEIKHFPFLHYICPICKGKGRIR